VSGWNVGGDTVITTDVLRGFNQFLWANVKIVIEIRSQSFSLHILLKNSFTNRLIIDCTRIVCDSNDVLI
jgi:hypothetical protein